MTSPSLLMNSEHHLSQDPTREKRLRKPEIVAPPQHKKPARNGPLPTHCDALVPIPNMSRHSRLRSRQDPCAQFCKGNSTPDGRECGSVPVKFRLEVSDGVVLWIVCSARKRTFYITVGVCIELDQCLEQFDLSPGAGKQCVRKREGLGTFCW